MVASRGKTVVAVDLSCQGMCSAVQQHACTAVSFVQGDGTSLPFGDGTFGAAISLETVEHISHDTQFVAELGRVLRANGMLLLSTPNRAQTGVRNPHHIREYLLDELLQLLAPHFSVQRIYGQFAHPRLTVLGRLGLPLGSINRLLMEHVPVFTPVRQMLAGWCPELFQGYKPLQEGEIHFSESAPELGSHFFVCCLKG
jgi:SAM-dependent methyltransferase